MGKLYPKCTLFREVTAKVAFYVLSISFRIQQGRVQALSSGGTAQSDSGISYARRESTPSLTVHSPQ